MTQVWVGEGFPQQTSQCVGARHQPYGLQGGLPVLGVPPQLRALGRKESLM